MVDGKKKEGEGGKLKAFIACRADEIRLRICSSNFEERRRNQ